MQAAVQVCASVCDHISANSQACSGSCMSAGAGMTARLQVADLQQVPLTVSHHSPYAYEAATVRTFPKSYIRPTAGLALTPLSVKVINKPENSYYCLEEIRKRAACTGPYERQLLCSHKQRCHMYRLCHGRWSGATANATEASNT